MVMIAFATAENSKQKLVEQRRTPTTKPKFGIASVLLLTTLPFFLLMVLKKRRI